MHYTRGRVKTRQGSLFPPATLPSPEETTANHRRVGSSTRRERIMMSTAAFTNESHTNARACSLYMTAGESSLGTGKLRRGQGHKVANSTQEC